MEDFVKFLNDYKEIIVGVLCLLSTLLCIILKRRPQTIEDLVYIVNDVCNKLPEIINSVERPGFGEDKKNEVERKALLYVSRALGHSLTRSERNYAIAEIDVSIESILSTPQKKG